jgi:ribosomal-protein-alanine N-acetyltransferase
MAGVTRTGAPDGRRGQLQISVWSEDDIDELGAYWMRNREHLLPTQPHRDPAFWTVDGQRQRVERAADDVATGRIVPFLVREDGRLVGEVMLSDVAGGAFCSANLGYSVDGQRLRLGIAAWAVAAVVDVAFSDLALHRLQAGTMLDNIASQKVLERCEFVRIGVAAQYLAIAGSWRDHVLWQRTNPGMPPPSP